MENNQLNNPGANHKRQDKDTNLQDTNSNIEIKNPSIGVLDLKNEIAQTIKQGNRAKEVKENHFPVEVFPSHIQKIITATNKNLNFPIDFIGGSILYTVSIAIGNALRAEVMWKKRSK